MPSHPTIPVLDRTLSLLEALAEHPEGLSAKRLSLELGIPPATCYRILRTLRERGWLKEGEEGDYHIGFGLVRLTRAYASLEHRLRELQPLLRQLTQETGLSTKISVREGEYAVSVARSEALRPSIITSPIGTRIHLSEAGSTGLVLLGALEAGELTSVLRKIPKARREGLMAQIATAREEGLARSYGTDNPAIHAVSIPLDAGGPAALTLVGWPDHFPAKLRREVEARLRKLRPTLSGA